MTLSSRRGVADRRCRPRRRGGRGCRQLRVWSVEPLAAQRATAAQPAGRRVQALLARDGDVWAGVGTEVVVWGGEMDLVD